ncbi:hypothetical protein P0E69_10875 [Chimaeribacter arupi]|uniref:hypothetical protein n=1 Tax=Chimaeribacter arupi TaxID=2060066 RepID=UPI002711DEE5|nr:hypothetical protein [Chimaeribacter arupi]WKZ90777.1 hypothetical protein P0E69_10875 [Chimaeribacter arupi]
MSEEKEGRVRRLTTGETALAKSVFSAALRYHRITTGEGKVYTGMSDEKGRTLPVYTAMPDKMKVEIVRSK